MISATVNPRVLAIALAAGLVFAAGLALGGMLDPRKVQGFLDVGALFGWGGGKWDPSLAFVMGGALMVSLFAFTRVKPQDLPWEGKSFELPTSKDIDVKLIVGAILFGAGWAIAGYCPGPAFASLLTGGTDILWFMGAMLPAMFVAKKWFG